MSVALVASGSGRVTVKSDGTVEITRGKCEWKGNTLHVRAGGGGGGGSLVVNNTFSGGISLAGVLGLGRIASSSSSSVASFIGNRVVFSGGDEYVCEPGQSMSIVGGQVYVDGAKVIRSKRKRADEGPVPQPSKVPEGKVINSVTVTGGAHVDIDPGAPVSDHAMFHLSGNSTVSMGSERKNVTVHASGNSDFTMRTVPTTSVTVNASGNSNVTIG